MIWPRSLLEPILSICGWKKTVQSTFRNAKSHFDVAIHQCDFPMPSPRGISTFEKKRLLNESKTLLITYAMNHRMSIDAPALIRLEETWAALVIYVNFLRNYKHHLTCFCFRFFNIFERFNSLTRTLTKKILLPSNMFNSFSCAS